MTVGGMLTACTFDDAMDTEMFVAFVAFVAFVEQFLAPRLAPGQVVVLDNLSAHQSPRVDRLVESAGARVLRLPAYSPDLNPIEMAISKVKSLLRKARAAVGRRADRRDRPRRVVDHRRGRRRLHSTLWLLRYVRMKSALIRIRRVRVLTDGTPAPPLT